MTDLAIIADDLTGALDAAAPFAGMRSGAIVATTPDSIPAALALKPSVIAVSTRSRDMRPEDARNATSRAIAVLPEGIRCFKKIDSRLKGQIAAELAAFGDRPLLVAPAIPAFGRTVRNGALEGFGVESPMQVRSRLGSYGGAASVPDTATNEDLRTALAETSENALLVGARGLAEALAQAIDAPLPPKTPPLPHPLCIAVGSSDPITVAQVAKLRSTLPEVLHIPAPSGTSSTKTPRPLPAVTVLQVTQGAETPSSTVAKNFAITARAWLEDALSMVLTGGATAEACLDALEIDVLTIAGEPVPGIPFSMSGDKTIVTKSGGFGRPDALLRLAGSNQTTEV